MRIPVLFESAHATAEREVLVNSGATDNFISKTLLHQLKIAYLPVETPIKICNATAGVIVRRARFGSFRSEVVSGLQYRDE